MMGTTGSAGVMSCLPLPGWRSFGSIRSVYALRAGIIQSRPGLAASNTIDSRMLKSWPMNLQCWSTS
jgi:hypothetical protein